MVVLESTVSYIIYSLLGSLFVTSETLGLVNRIPQNSITEVLIALARAIFEPKDGVQEQTADPIIALPFPPILPVSVPAPLPVVAAPSQPSLPVAVPSAPVSVYVSS